MANVGHGRKFETAKVKLLNSALNLFLKKGYGATKISEITGLAKVDGNAVARVFGDKERLVAHLIKHILFAQFEVASNMAKGKTDDKLNVYLVQNALQLYMAEHSEQLRELYSVAYASSSSSLSVGDFVKDKLKACFPTYCANDLFALEIAVDGVLRNFILTPCNSTFTIGQKIDKYLNCATLLFEVDNQKKERVKKFVTQFDYSYYAKRALERILEPFEN